MNTFDQYLVNKKNYQNIKLIGGKRYGNGCKGTVYDINSSVPNDKLSISQMIEANKNNIAEIGYYTVNTGQISYEKFSDLLSEHFIKFLSSLDPMYVAKVFLKEKDFQNEIRSNELVTKILSNPSLRSIHIVEFMSQKIYGFKIRLNQVNNDATDTLYNSNELWISFLIKCQQTVSKMQINLNKGTNIHTLGKFVTDIGNSILLLQGKGMYVHCDIKGDNLMLCGDNFNLIDWDKMLADTPGNNNLYVASPSHTNPLQFPSISIAKLCFIYRSIKKKGGVHVKQSNILIRGISYKDLVHFSGCEIISKNEYNKYKAMNADPFSLGMTIFELCHKDVKNTIRRMFIDSDPKGQYFNPSLIYELSENHTPGIEAPFETPVRRIYQLIMLLARCTSTDDLMRILSKVSYLTHDLWINTNNSTNPSPNPSLESDQDLIKEECELKRNETFFPNTLLQQSNQEELEKLIKRIDEMTDSNGNILDPKKVDRLMTKLMASTQ